MGIGKVVVLYPHNNTGMVPSSRTYHYQSWYILPIHTVLFIAYCVLLLVWYGNNSTSSTVTVVGTGCTVAVVVEQQQVGIPEKISTFSGDDS